MLLFATTINYMDRLTLVSASVRVTREFGLNDQQYGNIELGGFTHPQFLRDSRGPTHSYDSSLVLAGLGALDRGHRDEVALAASPPRCR